MIAPAERLPNLDQLHTQHVACEVHRHLAGNGECLGPCLRAQTLRRDAPAARHHLLHAIDARRRPTRAAVPGSFLTLADLVRERFARQLDRDLAVLERGEQQQLDDTPLQLLLYASLKNREVTIELADRKSTRLNSSHANISYAVFCLKKKKKQ